MSSENLYLPYYDELHFKIMVNVKDGLNIGLSKINCDSDELTENVEGLDLSDIEERHRQIENQEIEPLVTDALLSEIEAKIESRFDLDAEEWQDRILSEKMLSYDNANATDVSRDEYIEVAKTFSLEIGSVEVTPEDYNIEWSYEDG